MIRNIQKICNENYGFLNKHVPLLLGNYESHMLHNTQLSQNYKAQRKQFGPHTFEGAYSCGATCYLLHAKLSDKDISTKMMIKKIGYGKYLEDHCFLQYNDIIIDPTYRQFFTHYIREENQFSRFLFQDSPFVFVGNMENLQCYYQKLELCHLQVFQKNLEVKLDDFWKNAKVHNIKLDANQVLQCREYAENKGEWFLKLHERYNKI